jgi:hypothetical protein
MKPALITGAAAGFAYLTVMLVSVTREYQTERATRRAWNHYRRPTHG